MFGLRLYESFYESTIRRIVDRLVEPRCLLVKPSEGKACASINQKTSHPPEETEEYPLPARPRGGLVSDTLAIALEGT